MFLYEKFGNYNRKLYFYVTHIKLQIKNKNLVRNVKFWLSWDWKKSYKFLQ